LPKYAYGQIAVMLSPNIFKYGSESSMKEMFEGTNFLETFAAEE